MNERFEDLTQPGFGRRMGTSITVRITLTILIVIVATVSLTAYLNHAKFERSLNNLARSRFAFVLGDIKNTIEISMNLGLQLTTLRNTQEVLEREQAQDRQILAIDVYDDANVFVFSTQGDAVGKTAPSAWLRQAAAAGEGAWSIDEGDATVIGVTLVNNFDKVVGGVVLRYSRGFYQQVSKRVFYELGQIALIIAAAAALLALVAYVIFLRGMRRSFLKMVSTIEILLGMSAGQRTAIDPKNPLETQFADYYKTAAANLDALQQTIEEVERLGRSNEAVEMKR